MCLLAGTLMGHATEALLHTNLIAAEHAISDGTELSQMYQRVQRHAITLLALQAPVAQDLRVVVGSLQIAADAERMGELAQHIAALARRRHPAAVLPEAVRDHFDAMGHIAVDLAADAAHAVLARDPVRAAGIRADDHAMNNLHHSLFGVLMDSSWTHGVSMAVDVTLLGRFYERFADHAVAIGDHVIFETSGRHDRP